MPGGNRHHLRTFGTFLELPVQGGGIRRRHRRQHQAGQTETDQAEKARHRARFLCGRPVRPRSATPYARTAPGQRLVPADKIRPYPCPEQTVGDVLDKPFHRLVIRTEAIRRRPLLAYGLAVVMPVLGMTIRFALGGTMDGFPFLTFVPLETLAAFLGGLGPGIVSAVLGGLIANYYLIGTPGSFSLPWPDGWVAMVFYTLMMALIIALNTGMLNALERLRASESRLEKRVEERTAALHAEIAERSNAEATIRQMQKMEALGQLTGGVAHDFNNMLSIVIGSIEMARRRLTGAEHPRIAQSLDNATEGARRAATLVARLLAFSRRQPLAPSILDANSLVTGMSDLLQRTLGEHIGIETVLAGGLWPSYVDAPQLENAVLNLAVNARDAMPDGGRLTIETANVPLDAVYAAAHEDVTAGDYVMISVSDTGTGMSPEVVERAFDPFFTTKDIGKGTGLGLSQVFGYVKQSGGHVKIYSEPGRGTSIKLYLPRHLGQGEDARQSLPQAKVEMGSTDTLVLVVEDDAQVRAMSAGAVRELGYGVVEAASGEEALEILKGGKKPALLFTDVVMTGLSGPQLAEQARQMQPGLKVLFTTGYTRNAIVHNGVLDPGVMLLPKPFTLDQLAARLHEALS
ncbi:MAG: response regulator [Alphaproteobacteria bacterium]|nr:response regulator [Alphaproteobacteria bacterium]